MVERETRIPIALVRDKVDLCTVKTVCVWRGEAGWLAGRIEPLASTLRLFNLETFTLKPGGYEGEISRQARVHSLRARVRGAVLNGQFVLRKRRCSRRTERSCPEPGDPFANKM